jgi:hypothetical protein
MGEGRLPCSLPAPALRFFGSGQGVDWTDPEKTQTGQEAPSALAAATTSTSPVPLSLEDVNEPTAV